MDGEILTEIRPIAPAFLGRSAGGEWTLLGRRCESCAEIAFGQDGDACQSCGSSTLIDVCLGDHGELWSYTVLRNPPPGNRRTTEPDRLPQALGLVEIGGAVRVMACIDVPVERLAIGMPLRLLTSELFEDSGVSVVGYSFGERQND